MKKILWGIVILFLLIFPLSVRAIETTDQLYIMIDILDDGSIKVREMATLKGSYNGRLRNIDFKNPLAPIFKGEEEDFNGSDIYNGSAISDVKIFSVDYGSRLDFDDLAHLTKEFNQVSNGYNGAYGIYTLTKNNHGINLKVYQPSTKHEAFYLEYIVHDVVVKHDDVAELAWNILGSEYEENINDLKVRVRLKEADSSMRVWAHGPLNGEITRINDQEVELSYDFLGAYNPIDIRMSFDLSLVEDATKYSHVKALPHILAVEEKKADQANREREKIRFQNNLVKGATLIWLATLGTTIVYVYLKYDKEHKVVLPSPYYRDLPSQISPEVLEYLLKKNVSTLGLSASILNLIDEGVIQLEETMERKKDYRLIKVEEKSQNRSLPEQEVLDLLFNTVGNGKEVTLNQVKKYGKGLSKAETFINQYQRWVNLSKREGEKEEFYQKIFAARFFPILIALFGFGLFFLHLILETESLLSLLILPLSILSIIYFIAFKKRTEKGAVEYTKWMAFKKFLLDFGRMDEKKLPEVTLWNKYLVYATVLGCAKEVEKQMKIRIEQMNLESTIDVNLSRSLWMNHMLRSTLSSEVSKVVNQAVNSSRASIAASRSSSGSGFGGGVSGGGGSFGGGGGGGRF